MEKFETACKLLEEALAEMEDPQKYPPLSDAVTERLNGILDKYGYRLADSTPDSRPDP